MGPQGEALLIKGPPTCPCRSMIWPPACRSDAPAGSGFALALAWKLVTLLELQPGPNGSTIPPRLWPLSRKTSTSRAAGTGWKMNHPGGVVPPSRCPDSALAPRMATLAVEAGLGGDERAQHLNSPDGSTGIDLSTCLLRRKVLTAWSKQAARPRWPSRGTGGRGSGF